MKSLSPLSRSRIDVLLTLKLFAMTDKLERAKSLYSWYRNLLTPMGVWPLNSTYVRFTICALYYAIHIGFDFADLYQVLGSLEMIILNLLESVYELMLLLKLIVMRYSPTLRKLMRRIEDRMDTKMYESTEEKEIYLKYNNDAKKFFKLYFSTGLANAVIYHLRPLEFRLRSVLDNETMPFVLPYRTRLFFEVNDSSTFWLVWTYQIPMIYIHTLYSVCIAYLLYLVFDVCAQLSILSLRVKTLYVDPRDEPKMSRLVFREIVELHLDILGIARDIDDAFNLVLLEELLVCTVILGLTSYSVIVNADVDNTGSFVAFLLYDAMMLLLIYGYCVAGESLIVESTNLYEAYYQCPWYDVSDSFKKQLIICMIGASKPVQLTGGGFYIFSLVSFTGILKTSAGYISMLRTII